MLIKQLRSKTSFKTMTRWWGSAELLVLLIASHQPMMTCSTRYRLNDN